jgi:integrase
MAKKRQDGEGSIGKRKDGLWQGSLSVKHPDGRSKRIYVYAKTASECKRKLKEKQQELDRGLDLFADYPTVESYLTTWLTYTVKPESSAKTYESYEETIRNRITPYIGAVKLKALKPEHIQRMVTQLQEKDYSQRTVQYSVGVLSRALNKAVLHGHLSRNPAQHVTPRVERRQIEPLTPAQARAFLEAVSGHRLEALYRVALGLGLRRGEILALRWSDVDLDTGKLTIRKAKTKAGERTLLLPDKLIRVLRAHWEFQQQERYFLGTEWKEHGMVFPSEVGTPMGARNLLRHFKASLQKAGLPESIRFHDLRHSCATFLVSQGVHPRVVMEILGHSKISLTMERYSHVMPETQRDALDSIGDMFG